jgi:plastocyanin
VAVLTVLAASCDKPPAPTPSPGASNVVRITQTGVTPKTIEISLGGRVLFINDDTRDHTIGSDPHPDHTDCPPINQVGLLQPGQQRETLNFVTARTCGYHDHELPTVTTLQGTIVTK